MPFSLLARIVAVLAIIAFIAGGLWKVRHGGIVDGRAEVQAKWDADKAEQAAAALKAKEAAQQKERELQEAADRLRRAKDAEIRDLNVRVGELANRLRNRPDRPADAPAGAASGARPGGCTGAELYRSDGEFLVRLAADADRVRLALRQCQAQYEKARDAVK